jgi:hypothetical protein
MGARIHPASYHEQSFPPLACLAQSSQQSSSSLSTLLAAAEERPAKSVAAPMVNNMLAAACVSEELSGVEKSGVDPFEGRVK